jgi:hypothetical protein
MAVAALRGPLYPRRSMLEGAGIGRDVDGVLL